MEITASEAIELMQERDDVTLETLAAAGFTVVTNVAQAQVQAAAAQPTRDEELFAAVEHLYTQARRVKGTRSGRAKRVLGDAEGLQPYRVIITKARS